MIPENGIALVAGVVIIGASVKFFRWLGQLLYEYNDMKQRLGR